MFRRAVKTILLFTLVAGLFGIPAGVKAAGVFSNLSEEHQFGESFTFSADLTADSPVEAVNLTFKPQSNGSSIVLEVSASRDGDLSVTYEIEAKDHFAPFTLIDYWFTAQLEDGSQIQSETATFTYEDNRFTWQTLDASDGYAIYWSEGELSFGQTVKDAIYRHFETYNQYLDLPTPEALSIYIYPTASAMQSALDLTNARWVAGHADPAEGIILVSIPTGFDQALEIKRQIPHEIVHIQLYLEMQENYTNLPVWYSEGLASLAEQYTSGEYAPILQAGWENGDLIPLSDLCQSFPSAVSEAALAYAQADSFTRYLFDTSGKFGLEALLAAYSSGHTCANGVANTFDVSLQTLEENWQTQTFGTPAPTLLTAEAAAWLGLFFIVLALPVGLVIFQMVRKQQKANEGIATDFPVE